MRKSLACPCAPPSVPCQRAGDVATAYGVAVRSYKAVSSGIKVTAWPVTFAVLMVFKGRSHCPFAVWLLPGCCLVAACVRCVLHPHGTSHAHADYTDALTIKHVLTRSRTRARRPRHASARGAHVGRRAPALGAHAPWSVLLSSLFRARAVCARGERAAGTRAARWQSLPVSALAAVPCACFGLSFHASRHMCVGRVGAERARWWAQEYMARRAQEDAKGVVLPRCVQRRACCCPCLALWRAGCRLALAEQAPPRAAPPRAGAELGDHTSGR